MVDYVCAGGCTRALPISQLYYCVSCPRLACQYCVSEEIDSYYCPNCLENLASAEASAFQNRCKKCFGCPVCFTALTPASNAAGDLFYFSCGYCRWSSLDIGMKSDQLVKLISDNNSRERNNTHQQAISALVDELRRETKAAEKEKRLRERFRLRRAAPLVTTPVESKSRPSLSATESERQAKEEALSFKGKRSTSPLAAASLPSPQVVPDASDLHGVTTLAQRFCLLNTQPRSLSALAPHRIPLMTRRSCRCKGKDKEDKPCEKLLVKPEFSLTRAEFKRQLSALLLLPSVSFRLSSPLVLGQSTRLVLGFSNPLKAVARFVVTTKTTSGVTLTLPAQILSVGCIDAADLDDEYENDKKNDKPDVVVSRKSNVLCVACTVMPTQQGAVEATITLSGSSKPATGEMQFAVDVILRLGNVVEGVQK